LILRITVLMVLFVLTESLWFRRGWLESLMFALAWRSLDDDISILQRGSDLGAAFFADRF
jgi:hypothetical protein